MEPTHSRPWDPRPALDDNLCPQPPDLSHETIFAARVNNLIDARHHIYKQFLLDELYRLRRTVISVAATPNNPIASPPPPSTHTRPQLPSAPLPEQPSKLPSAVTPIPPHAHLCDQPSAQLNHQHFSPPLELDSRNPGTTHEPQETFQVTDPQSEQQRATLPSSQSKLLSRASLFRNPSSSASFSFEINVRRLPALSTIVSASRRISDVASSYNTTVLPFVVSSPTSHFSEYGQQDQFHPNRIPSLLQPSAQSLETSTNFVLELQTSENLRRLTDRHVAPYLRRHYVPPLLARLLFEQELAVLFDSQHHFSFSAQGVSLARATALYTQKLFPAQRSSLGSPPTHPRSKAQAKAPPPAIVPSEKVGFQCRTFYRSMTRAEELRTPAAAWREDKSYPTQEPPPLNSRRLQSHHAYAVSSDARNLPYSINLQGVHSATDSPSVTLAFGFQRRTNYPFRRTYNHTRSEKILEAAPKILPRASNEFASRVPVKGLTSTLLQLFQPDIHRGLFFSNNTHESPLELAKTERRPSSDILYSITPDGKLCQEKAG